MRTPNQSAHEVQRNAAKRRASRQFVLRRHMQAGETEVVGYFASEDAAWDVAGRDDTHGMTGHSVERAG